MGSAFFGRKYRGKSLEYYLKNGHPGLDAKYKIEGNQLSVEFAACKAFGIDPFVQLARSRDERKALVGQHLGQNMIDRMYDHDTRPKPKNKPGKKNK